MKAHFVACTLLVLSAPVFGADGADPSASMSVEALVAEAEKTNPELAFYESEIAAAKGERRAAAAWPNPELAADFGRKRAAGPAGEFLGEGNAWSVSVAQPLEFPGRIALRKAIANRQVDLARLGLEQFRATLASRVRSLALQLHVAQEQATAAGHAAQRGQDIIQVLVQRDPAGINPLLESRLIEATVVTLQSRATDATTRAAGLVAELNQLLGRSLDRAVKVAAPELDLGPLEPLDSLVARARTNNFDVRAQQLELAQQGLKVDLARKDRWEAITVTPFYSQEKAGDRESSVGVGVSIPLPLWNRNEGNIAAAESRQRQAETAMLVTQRRIERELRDRHAAYSARLTQISQWRPEILESLRQSAELADRHYRLGAVPVATYVELQEKYLDALETILTARADALREKEQIQLLTGGYGASGASVPNQP